MATIIGPGSSNVDVTGYAPRLPSAGETVLGTTLKIGPGGKGLNQMTAARRAGSDVVFISRYADDAFGSVLRACYRAEQIPETYISCIEGGQTGCALIEIDQSDAQNRIMVLPGVTQRVTADLVTAAEADFAACDAVLTQLEIPFETVTAAKELAAKYNKPFILNPAPFRPLPDGWLCGVDWLTPNETEAALLTGVSIEKIPEDAATAAQKILAMGVKNAVITLGVHGAYWTNGQESCHVGGIKVDAVDTTGAGDTFNGALATAIGEGFPVAAALQFANAAAAVSVTRHGAAVSCPTRQEIEDMMHRHYGQDA